MDREEAVCAAVRIEKMLVLTVCAAVHVDREELFSRLVLSLCSCVDREEAGVTVCTVAGMATENASEELLQ